jgi:regulator of replication initiation timing
MRGVLGKIFRKTCAVNGKIRIFVAQFQTDCIVADLSVIVSDIELKLRNLLDEKSRLAKENKRLTEENEALQHENVALRQSAGELKDKINKSTIVNVLDNEGELEEGRKLIKDLVREIDRCVSILNSKE